MDDMIDAARHIVPSLPGLTRQTTVIVSERKRPMDARVKPARMTIPMLAIRTRATINIEC